MATASVPQTSKSDGPAPRALRRRKVDESRRVVSHEQMLAASLTEFAEAGFEETTLASIGRRLGVTAPLLIYHFGSKDMLWRSAVDQGFKELDRVLDAAVEDARGADGRAGLETLVRRLVHFFAGQRDLHRVLLHEACMRGERLEWIHAEYLSAMLERVQAIFERAVREGAVRDMPFHQALFLVLGAASNFLESDTLRVALYGTTRLRAEQLNDYTERLLEFCFGGLRSSTQWMDDEPMRLAAAG
jgi:TetR/AcrR family transcriptional regulator